MSVHASPLELRFREVARLIASGETAEARDLVVDSMVELVAEREHILGYGARPKWREPESATEIAAAFELVARAAGANQFDLAAAMAVETLRFFDGGDAGSFADATAEREHSVADLFFSASATAQDIARVVATPSAWSSGVIRHSARFHQGSGHPERAGLHCPKVFGSMLQDACMCGRARDHDQRCQHCGVVCGSVKARDENFGHLVVPPVRHPRAPEIEIRLVPVIPPGDRPLLAACGSRLVTAPPSVLDQAYVNLANRAHRVERRIESNAGAGELDRERRLLQLGLEELLSARSRC